MNYRKLRTAPSTKATVSLSERDCRILLALAECSYLSTAQIARDGFPSEDRCRKRLRKLHDARLTSVLLLTSRDSNVLSITRAGLIALRDLGYDVTGLAPPPPLRATGAAHFLMTNDTRLYLANFEVEGIGELVEWHSGKSDLARQLGLTVARIAPDALAIVQLSGSPSTVLAIESDRGFETADLQDKINKYSRLPRPLNFELWCIATGDASRLRQIRGMCTRAGVGAWTRLIPHDHVLERPIVAPPPLLGRGG